MPETQPAATDKPVAPVVKTPRLFLDKVKRNLPYLLAGIAIGYFGKKWMKK
jgi:hypothetical protein